MGFPRAPLPPEASVRRTATRRIKLGLFTAGAVAVSVGIALVAAPAGPGPTPGSRAQVFSTDDTSRPPAPANAPTAQPRTSPHSQPRRVGPRPTTAVAAAAGSDCRNSTDVVCGPFRWDPAPGANAAMGMSVRVSPERPRPGETVTFRVVATDPDAPFESPCPAAAFGDGRRTNACPPGLGFRGLAECPMDGYGPWTPPSRQAGRIEHVFRHAYDNEGTYDVALTLRSRRLGLPIQNGEGGPCTDPYGDEGTVTTRVVVRLLPT